MTIPPKVKVLGTTVTVKAKKLSDDEGHYEASKREIALDKGLPRQAIGEVLVHELAHCLLHLSGARYVCFDGDDAREETFVRIITPAVWATLVHNADTVRELLASATEPCECRVRRNRKTDSPVE